MPRVIPVMTAPSIAKPCHDQESENGLRPSNKMDICLKDKPFQLVKPLVVSMGLFGLLFLNCKTRKLSSITRTYSLIVLLLFTVRFIQLFFAYRDESFGPESFLKLVAHLWYLQNCVNAVVTYKACSNDNRLVEFLLKWCRLMKTNRGISPHDTSYSGTNYDRKVKRTFTIFMAISWILMFMNCVYEIYFLFKTRLTDFIIAPMPSDHSFALFAKVIAAFFQMYMSASWVFTLSLFIMMSDVIYREFETFHDDLRTAISPEGVIAEIEWFRQRHEDICQMVEIADDILSAFNAAGILFSACEAMLLLYTTITSPSVMADPMILLAHCFWLVATLLYLVLISYGGGYLNHIAHAPLKTIHTIRVKDASAEFSLQMTMFLNKLTGEPIGLTALDMFVIDKPTILTIAGAFITYFIVLLQIQQLPVAVDSTVCNCTGFGVNSTLHVPKPSV